MSGYLWAAPAEVNFNTLLEKTTSELLPSSSPPDLVASLEIADLIRSSSVTPATATKSLLSRLTHANPNVQLLAIAVTDICIKNGGTRFLIQAGAKEFTTELELLARGKPDGNRDVKEKIVTKIQEWATAFEQMEKLKGTELVKTYQKLKNEDLPFPPRDATATAAMVDSLSAPEWTDATYCTRCRTEFTTFNRKHHCRNCGQVFDQQCSAQNLPLPHFGVIEPVRVCDGCVKKIKDGKGATVVGSAALGRSSSLGAGGSGGGRPDLPERSSTVSYSGGKRKSFTTSTSTSASASARKAKEDADLQAAIAASLADVGGSGSSTSGPAFQPRDPPTPIGKGYSPAYQSFTKPPPFSPASKPKPVTPEEEDDPDLAAAIAASLRDVASQPSAPGEYDPAPAETYASLYPSATAAPYSSSYDQYQPLHQQQQYYQTEQRPRFTSLPSFDLSPTESSTIAEFSSTLERPPPVLGERERELYVHAQAAAPRLVRGLEDAERRKEILVEMNTKLGEATRLYEGMLEERVRGATMRAAGYAPQQYAPYQQQPPQQAYHPSQNMPPSSYGPSTTYAPPPPPFAAPAPPIPFGQPLPAAVLQEYQQHQQQQQQTSTSPIPASSIPAPTSPQPQSQPQVQPPQPAGYYKPSSFPAVPSGPQAMFFPHVPTENPWERQQQQREQEATPVGELIEL